MPRAPTSGNGSPTLPPQTDDEGTAMGEPKAVQDEEQAAPSRPSGISTNTVTASNHGAEPKNPDLVSQPRQKVVKRQIHIHLSIILRPSNQHELILHGKKVTWNGPDDPENPKNWPMRKKWVATLVVSAFTFISPVSSSMVAPALGTMADQFDITSSVESQMMLSIFVLAYAIGPLFFGPLSESFGRWPVLLLSNLFYLAWNLGCGFSQNAPEMLVFRFLSGIGGSAPLAVGGGVLR